MNVKHLYLFRAIWEIKLIGKFLGSGFAGTMFHYAILLVLVNTHHLSPVTASSIGMFAGAVIVYVLNYHITFCSSKNHIKALTRFIPMVMTGFIINGLILTGAMEYLSMPLIISQILATFGQFLFGFCISKTWIF
jgi:putative flippase GtrA